MKKSLFLLYLSIVLISTICVSAGPMRNIIVTVTDPIDIPIEGANVSMYVPGSQYFHDDSLTDEFGVAILTVDARAYVLANNNSLVSTDEITVKKQKDSRERDIYSILFPTMDFYFNIAPTDLSSDFIPITVNESFNLRYDNIEFEYTVTDGIPIIELPEFSINELNNTQIIINLEDYIIDYDNTFEELTITLEDYSWSAAEAEIYIQNNELIVEFFPSLDLVYHQDNFVTFTIGVNDGEHYVEDNATWEYNPIYKALKGYVIDMYDASELDDYDIGLYNGPGVYFENDNEFIVFYDILELHALINISLNGYHTSKREILFTGFEDIELNFTIAPVQIDPYTNLDHYESAFTYIFRWGAGTVKYYNPPTIAICDAPYSGNYDPTDGEIQLALNAIAYIENFTGGFYIPIINENLFITNDAGECFDYSVTNGVITIYWNPNLPVPGDFHTTVYNNYSAIKGSAFFNDNVSQKHYIQNILLAFGADGTSFWFDGIFCDQSTCTFTEEPADFEMAWGLRQSDRQTRNYASDTDYWFIVNPLEDNIIYEKEKVYYEEIRDYFRIYNDGKKVSATKIIGYLKKGQTFKNTNDLVQKYELPEDAIIIGGSIKPDAIDMTKIKNRKHSISKELRNKLQFLFN